MIFKVCDYTVSMASKPILISLFPAKGRPDLFPLHQLLLILSG
ncbi:hypothetical protein RchiOBHm_Chr5g0060831 [Rosa chinensis]|uniref:Uncharacterized protein n=1 Tax=Rosa chinensis TaxID=74649 RepID=A0A2P6QHS9_ROSCH|nr:hypothetical protein RchiOBHm_Chr5g0060831 [Rosa chinensis]